MTVSFPAQLLVQLFLSLLFGFGILGLVLLSVDAMDPGCCQPWNRAKEWHCPVKDYDIDEDKDVKQ